MDASAESVSGLSSNKTGGFSHLENTGDDEVVPELSEQEKVIAALARLGINEVLDSPGELLADLQRDRDCYATSPR